MGTTSDRSFIAMDSARMSAEARTSRGGHESSFMAGVAACRAALLMEFGEDSGFAGRLMGIIDNVEPDTVTSRTATPYIEQSTLPKTVEQVAMRPHSLSSVPDGRLWRPKLNRLYSNLVSARRARHG